MRPMSAAQPVVEVWPIDGDNEDLNNFWDSAFSGISIGAYSFNAGELLFELDPQAYSAECKIFRSDAFEVINDEPLEEPSGGNA